ncbi:MAG: four-carbon acid sugar kinase family protein [Microvirga sp.]
MAQVPLIAFYGDDFTGSTDALECLAAAGLRTILFTDVPSPGLLSRFEGLEAIGIAGNSRGLTPEEMEPVMQEALGALRRTGAPILHYKVCSTFDSSPAIGSFGRVMDIAQRVLGPRTIPIVVGAPRLGRYSLFGTLFARHNVDGAVYRIDRHPTMSVHPTTPMREGDMRRHIGAQTAQSIALLAAPDIAGPVESAQEALDRAVNAHPGALMMDIADDAGEARVGMLLERMANEAAPLFVVGSSGVEYALVGHWKAQGRLSAEVPMAPAGPVDRLFVVSGSCSPSTGAQIAAACATGFAAVALDPVALITEGEDGPHLRAAVGDAVRLLESGRDVVVHSSTGPSDGREAAVAAHFSQAGLTAGEGRIRGGRALASAAGRILAQVLDRVALERFMVAGGDTSTAAIKMLGLEALEMIAPLVPGAPLCRILGPGHPLDGRQVVLKGGQMGGPAFFAQVKAGRV